MAEGLVDQERVEDRVDWEAWPAVLPAAWVSAVAVDRDQGKEEHLVDREDHWAGLQAHWAA